MRFNIVRFALGIGLSLVLLGCGNGNQARPVNLSGNWTATLQKPNGATAFSFAVSLTEVGGSLLNVTNLTFNPATSCFQSQVTASGQVQFATSGYGYYTGGGTTAMALTIRGLSAASATDTLVLQGTANASNSVSGTWTLNGVSVNCSGSGGFTMTKS